MHLTRIKLIVHHHTATHRHPRHPLRYRRSSSIQPHHYLSRRMVRKEERPGIRYNVVRYRTGGRSCSSAITMAPKSIRLSDCTTCMGNCALYNYPSFDILPQTASPCSHKQPHKDHPYVLVKQVLLDPSVWQRYASSRLLHTFHLPTDLHQGSGIRQYRVYSTCHSYQCRCCYRFNHYGNNCRSHTCHNRHSHLHCRCRRICIPDLGV